MYKPLSKNFFRLAEAKTRIMEDASPPEPITASELQRLTLKLWALGTELTVVGGEESCLEEKVTVSEEKVTVTEEKVPEEEVDPCADLMVSKHRALKRLQRAKLAEAIKLCDNAKDILTMKRMMKGHGYRRSGGTVNKELKEPSVLPKPTERVIPCYKIVDDDKDEQQIRRDLTGLVEPGDVPPEVNPSDLKIVTEENQSDSLEGTSPTSSTSSTQSLDLSTEDEDDVSSPPWVKPDEGGHVQPKRQPSKVFAVAEMIFGTRSEFLEQIGKGSTLKYPENCDDSQLRAIAKSGDRSKFMAFLKDEVAKIKELDLDKPVQQGHL